jgi:hypothetical protein
MAGFSHRLVSKRTDKERGRVCPPLSSNARGRRERFQVAINQRERKSHHVEITAFNAVDELGCEALDRIRAGFIHRFAAGDIIFNFAVIESDKMNPRRFAVDNLASGMSQADPGNYRVLAPRKRAQHGRGFASIGWFFKDLVSYNDHRIRPQHDLVCAFPGGVGFRAGESLNVIHGQFAGCPNFLNRPRAYCDLKSGDSQQFTPAGRLRCKD